MSNSALRFKLTYNRSNIVSDSRIPKQDSSFKQWLIPNKNRVLIFSFFSSFSDFFAGGHKNMHLLIKDPIIVNKSTVTNKIQLNLTWNTTKHLS
jgi:hypothetical protein